MSSSVTHRADGKLRFSDGAVLFSLACLALLVASRLLPPDGIPGVDLCAFHALTALPCPGCGLTRAFCAISNGQFRDAWNLHPFSFPLYAAVLVGAAVPMLNRRFPMLSRVTAAKSFWVWVLLFAASLVIFGAWRAKAQWKASQAALPTRSVLQIPGSVGSVPELYAQHVVITLG